MSSLGKLKEQVVQMKKEVHEKRNEAILDFAEGEEDFYKGQITALHSVLQVIENLLTEKKKRSAKKHGHRS